MSKIIPYLEKFRNHNGNYSFVISIATREKMETREIRALRRVTGSRNNETRIVSLLFSMMYRTDASTFCRKTNMPGSSRFYSRYLCARVPPACRFGTRR